ncbi:MAG: hypothetical protein ACK504_09250 [Bacteroidota bacterium]
MKKTLITIFTISILFSCKKKTETLATETPTSTTKTTLTKYCTFSYNDNNFSASSFIGNIPFDVFSNVRPSYSVTFFGPIGSNQILGLTGKIQTGTYPLDGSTSHYITFQTNNKTYTSNSGTLTITANDTLNNGLKKFQATFSFQTDVVSGTSYTITGGDALYIP